MFAWQSTMLEPCERWQEIGRRGATTENTHECRICQSVSHNLQPTNSLSNFTSQNFRSNALKRNLCTLWWLCPKWRDVIQWWNERRIVNANYCAHFICESDTRQCRWCRARLAELTEQQQKKATVKTIIHLIWPSSGSFVFYLWLPCVCGNNCVTMTWPWLFSI